MDSIRRTIIQGEILALLHDIGKLSWPFIAACLKLDGEKDPQKAHTSRFLERNMPDQPLGSVLRRNLEGWLCTEGGQSARTPSALLITHHQYELAAEHFHGAVEGQDFYPHAMLLSMYADTADSLFTKGSETVDDKVQDRESLHLASPLGGREAAIDRKNVDETAGELALAIEAWAEGIDSWDDVALVKKRRDLIGILREHSSFQLAETRLPDNDVTLFQHSYSVSSIFKALLAGCLLHGNWDGLLNKGGLAHSSQKLSLLAVQWNEEAFLARSMRSYEIAGRREALEGRNGFAEKMKRFVEEELALGNEIYRDHKGICFMVPSLGGERSEALEAALARLLGFIEEQSNARPIHGTLPWKVMHKESGLVLTAIHDFWNAPFDSAENLIAFGPSSPAWMEDWKGGDKQICPRCGLHPLEFSYSRTGSDADKVMCDTCKGFSETGFKLAENSESFWNNAEGRLALIQAVLPQDVLCSGSVFRGTLDGRAREWRTRKADTMRHWQACRNAQDSDRADAARKFFLELGALKGGMNKKDGWCSHVPDDSGSAAYVRAYLETMVPELRGGARLDSVEKEAEAILWWALSQTPAPSRMARLWEKAREFTMFEPEVPHILLTRDVSSFQMLVYAKDAMKVLRAVTALYEAQFAHVRHLLPLHLSATVFKSKSPLYLAMDAARRFRRHSERGAELWTLESRNSTSLAWQTAGGRRAIWNGMGGDAFRGWFVSEDGTPVHVSALEAGKRYEVRPSTFDFEVLDAFARRYDIACGEDGQRAHYMSSSARPRPYPLETMRDWSQWDDMFKDDQRGKHQRKTAIELLARLHLDWDDCTAPVFRDMARDIMNVTTDKGMADSLCDAACDGSFFDICEWYDFIGK